MSSLFRRNRKAGGHKGKSYGAGSKALGADFEKLQVSKRDSPVRHAEKRKTIRPGQLANYVDKKMDHRGFKPLSFCGDTGRRAYIPCGENKPAAIQLNAHVGQQNSRDPHRIRHMQHNHAAQHYQRSTMPPPPKRVSQTFPRGTAVSPPPPVLSSERAELTLRLPDESNQDHAWIPQHSQDTTPHYNCTPDEQPTALPARPPAPPSPKSHRRANRGPRFFPDADSDEDSAGSREETPGESASALDLEGAASNRTTDTTQEMDGADESTSESRVDNPSPQFQISTALRLSSTCTAVPRAPNCTPTPEGRQEMGGPIISAVDEGTVVPVPSVAVLNYHEVHPPAHLDPNPKMETYRRKAKCNTCNTNPFSTYPQVSRRSGSSKGVAGITVDQCSDYEWLETLGQGSYGTVIKVRRLIDGWVYAIKKSERRLCTELELKNALREVFALAAIHSPFIVRYYHSFIEDNHLYILTELCEFGSLERIAKAHKPCCEHYLLCLLWDMARALVHLHQRRMVHLDIKPENIFSVSPLDPYAHSAGSLRVLAVLQPLDALDKMTCDESMPPSPGPFKQQSDVALDPMEPRFKLGDCGLVTSDDVRGEVEEGDRKYLSREFLDETYTDLRHADMFALGITLYELATATILPENGEAYQDLRNGRLEPMPALSEQFQDLIRRMTSADPEERPIAKDLASFAERQLRPDSEMLQSRRPRKSGPFSPMESPVTARERNLENRLAKLKDAMLAQKQQLENAQVELQRLQGGTSDVMTPLER